ncbi:Sua5/YciO/YrdC/YwlC family protein [Algiphilus sp. NNCM1]|uniref:L-threonylcarbamoyladenylate synthase n=1 Tax=Algiphilus sp. TaxID=1872431 RepID=UPI001CA703A1|nr:Sua5/YciO/YrdC/YwlC family protein [Algiphilus sp.]MBY8964520.1 Sua5/YciO/YrdC/YwlC family protein [Algiphilus acroporae]MCI5063366.1 Sua5/YciO/YrdC/YwlC family protein [Algiphilus sp.]MCI5104744.1 Sua5/YciO/YrdC/YwlC family protein [Algiphilus sp.]
MLALAYREAAEVLARGGLVAYPTEGVWGLGCDPRNPAAVGALLAAKQRPVDKGLILISDHFEALEAWITLPSRSALKRAFESWPGPTTWLFPARSDAPYWITGDSDRIAIRVTNHPVAARLCKAWGEALVSTSANRNGLPPADGATAVRRQFSKALDYLVPGALGGLGRPSTIRDVRSGQQVR